MTTKTAGITKEDLIEEFGQDGLDLILTVFINFYYSEQQIIDLCAKWVRKRKDFTDKSLLVLHASDEVQHANIFKNGVERLGIDWESLDLDSYIVQDIKDRFERLFNTEDEFMILVGLNMYAEGVLALEEIEQLSASRPDIFWGFDTVYTDEKNHLNYGLRVAKKYLQENPQLITRAQDHCTWYENHFIDYLENSLGKNINIAIEKGFVSPNYIENLKQRFRCVMGELNLETTI